MYEYVPKSEYRPVREELEEIIKKVQQIMRKEHKLPFQFSLIGSGKRHLVTRVINGNAGFDFDYNLIIQAPRPGYVYKADVVKAEFIEAFKKTLKGTKYSFPKDSTSAITIKVIDSKNSKVRYSCDFAIIYRDEESDDESEYGYYYLRNNKNQNNYEFVFRPLRFNIDERLDEILNEYSWNVIRDEYLKLKNSNAIHKKHSFSLYNEAVNNVYNQLFLQN